MAQKGSVFGVATEGASSDATEGATSDATEGTRVPRPTRQTEVASSDATEGAASDEPCLQEGETKSAQGGTRAEREVGSQSGDEGASEGCCRRTTSRNSRKEWGGD